MSSLSPNALAFIPLADLLIQLQSLINQFQPRLLSSDMTASSDKNNNSYPATFPYFRVCKGQNYGDLKKSQLNKLLLYIILLWFGQVLGFSDK
jgi:hypothetical protein